MSGQTSLNIGHHPERVPEAGEITHGTTSITVIGSHRERQKTQPSQNGERLLTVAEVAVRLGMSQQWVRDHIDRRSPKIDVVRWGAAVRFRVADVDRFILEHVNAPRRRKRSR